MTTRLIVRAGISGQHDTAQVMSWRVSGRSWGRVGDSALIGAGTYADNRLGGVSTTGHGEAFIRTVLAKTALDILRDLDDPEPACGEQIAQTRGGEAFTEGGHDAPGDEDVLGNDRSRINHHGVSIYRTRATLCWDSPSQRAEAIDDVCRRPASAHDLVRSRGRVR